MIYLALLFALVGLYVSYRIHQSKIRKQPLACPREAPCDRVIRSSYGTTLGIGNEVWGSVYYTFIIILIAMVITLAHPLWVVLYAFVAIFGALASLYLVSIQAFVLRAWCAWCLGSVVCNFALAILGLALYAAR